MNFSHADDRRPKTPLMSMTPMIDVTFLLLVFFLISTSQTPPESALAPGLQAISAEGGASADLEQQSVELVISNGAPAYRVGSRLVRDRESLASILETLPRGPGIFVKGSGDVDTGFAAAALQVCRDAGFTKVTYVPIR